MSVLKRLRQRREENKKSIAVLVDPDKIDDPSRLLHLIHLASENCVDCFFVGGSLVTTSALAEVVKAIKQNVTLPVVLFPGNAIQVDASADAILFLSLISGRNPELLISQHVVAATILKNTRLEVIPTGYMLINSGRLTSVAYISNTMPIPDDKYSLAASTAMAGQMLGLQSIYIDAGSGAEREISPKMIAAVRKVIQVPWIVGGGINTAQKACNALEAGADMIVIGNALETNPQLRARISEKIYESNRN